MAGSYDDFLTAIKRDHRHTIEALLQRGFDPNSVDETGQPGIIAALLNESYEVADALASSDRLQLEAVNQSGETALMMASLRGQVALVQRLLQRGAAVNRPGWSPLHYAAAAPDDAPMKLLLARGAAVDARAPNGTTPLMLAADSGSSACVDLLLAAGARADLKNDLGLTAADVARQRGRDRLADQLGRRAAPP
ncbi:MAG: ankyrin repeat domain-containing protein [Burkholderiaceae bacterium]|nr:ankyrin repeat domain-containing protein [Burkholderiaceae bacterium]